MAHVTKRISGVLMAGFLVFPGVAAAQQYDGWPSGGADGPWDGWPVWTMGAGHVYVGIGAGLNVLEDNNAKRIRGPRTIEYDTGGLANLSLGYAFDNGLRLELEPGYRWNDTDKFGGVRVDGTTEIASAMLNAVYDLKFLRPDGIPLYPHVGGGIGYAHVFASGGPVHGGDDDLAYQVIAGLDYQLAPRLTLAADYRYFVATDTNLDIGATGLKSHLGDFDNHAILLSLRFALAAAEAPAPLPAHAVPSAPAIAAPVPAPSSYTVYFDLDSAALTGSALGIVDQAAVAAKTGTNVRVNVTGYTDTTGSAAYNRRLSERRAAAVKAELVRQGVPANEIMTAGRGESEPAVPTRKGVREARNRRVQIVVGGAPGA